MSDNDDETKEEEPVVDPVAEHVEETLDSSKNITLDHLNAMKKQLDDRMDTITRDKTKDDQEKSELKALLKAQEDRIKELADKLEEKTKEEPGETMLIAPKELNPPQQNDGVEDVGKGGDTPPPKQKRKGWRKYV